MADGIATDLAKGMASNVIAGVIKQIKNIVELDEKLGRLKTNFGHMEALLLQIDQRFQEQQKRLPEAIAVCLTGMSDHLTKGEQLISRANRQRRRCFGCCLLYNPNLFTQITDWEIRFDQVFQELERVFSISANIQPIVSAAAPQAGLRQSVPDSGFVGSTIESTQKQLQEWLTQPHPEARMIGVYGMGGVGKTSLLKLLYNHFQEVSGVFDVLIWVTVSQNCPIVKLQDSIAKTLKFSREEISDTDNLKMRLSASLVKKRFLLILDDIWGPIDLDEVGVKFGDQYSKVLMSSRRKDVIGTMGASDDYTLRIQPLSKEDGWNLFNTIAFTNGAVPMEKIEAIAREIACECQGLPLALNTVAAAMRPKKTEDEWGRALTLMRDVDPSFRTSYSSIDEQLYKRLKFSYDDLVDTKLKICFLYCVVFPEDAHINVKTLLEMWSAEKLITGMDAGNEFIDSLVSRGLFEYIDGEERRNIWCRSFRRYGEKAVKEKAVKVHDVLRDLAIDIGRREEKWFFGTGQHLQNFPSEDETRDCKRISVGHNDIQHLPTDLICSQLVSLVLAYNRNIREVPEGFLSTATSLKVLDLSNTRITSLPTSLGQLGRLELLTLSGCNLLKKLPENTGNLSSLRFLNLQDCHSLESLPDGIGDLRNLEHLNLEECLLLNSLPDGIGDLRNLKHLNLDKCVSLNSLPDGIGDLRNLKHLTLTGRNHLKKLPENTGNLSSLRFLNLQCCDSLKSLPDGIGDLRNLKHLNLDGCDSLNSLPDGIGKLGNLEHLTLRECRSLNSLPDSIGDLRNLKHLNLEGCSSLMGIPQGISHLTSLNKLLLAKYSDCCAMRVKDLANLSNLTELTAEVKPEIKEGTMTTWTEMRRLELHYANRYDVVEDILPLHMENMNKLESFYLFSYEGVSLPDCISWLQNLRNLELVNCGKLRALPACEIGNEIAGAGFPMLKKLTLRGLQNLESMVTSEETMSELEEMKIGQCWSFKRLGTKKLPALKKLEIDYCKEFEALEIGSGGLPMLEKLSLGGLTKLEITVGPTGVINDGVMPKLEQLSISDCPSLKTVNKLSNLRQLEIRSCDEWRQLEIGRGGFPMLETLDLYNCKNLESIVGPSDVWNEETIPKLQVVMIIRCPLLRRLPRGMEKLSELKQIKGELEWWQNIIWENDNEKMELSGRFHEESDSDL